MSCANFISTTSAHAPQESACCVAPPIDLSFVDHTVAEIGRGPEAVIAILQAIQEHYRYLPDDAMKRVCELTQITPAAIQGVSTFYGQFRHSPVGKHVLRVCHGTACHVKGVDLIEDAIRRELKLRPDEDTDAAREFTVQKVACLGCCTLAPVVQAGEVTYGHLVPNGVAKMLHDYRELAARGGTSAGAKKIAGGELQKEAGGEIRVGLGSCCMAKGSEDVQHALKAAVARTHAAANIKRVGCVGICHQTPMVEVVVPGKTPALYARVTADDAAAIVARHFPPPSWWRRAGNACSDLIERLFEGPPDENIERHAIDVRDPQVDAFLGRQVHIATEHCGSIDPLDLDEYLRHDGFKALRHCLIEMQPEAIIEQIRASGLRGRGGAGFLSGIKWAAVRASNGPLKYVICNGDEGDPGAFMDRMILESFPYRVIEGMTIAARATGASEGIFYIRAEYPLAVKRIGEAIRRCTAMGLLGDNIMDRGFKLTMRIVQGAGAFVCGEETALMASVEGRRGMPRLRPPFPAQSGLWEKPTLINNVETLALVPWIIRNGPDEFAKLGTPESRGTKVFALAGKVARGGLIEVPMGITLREIVDEIGGGIAGGKRFKAVQIGGPSGGCIPAALAETKVDYQALNAAGAIMGSGGMVVMDESDCMVDIARYFLQFTQTESCGRCTFCRIGTRRMRDILERLCAGLGKMGDLEELEHLAKVVTQGSLCGLGKTAPNPVLTTLKYFRDEYEAHLQKKCPAGKCKALIGYYVTDSCIGCTLCAQQCPADAILMAPYQKHEINLKKCTRCDTCKQVCPEHAIVVN